MRIGRYHPNCPYLANYVSNYAHADNPAIYQIVKTVGQMTAVLELTADTRYALPQIKR